MHLGDLNARIALKCLRAEHTDLVKAVASISISCVHKIQHVTSYLHVPTLFLILFGCSFSSVYSYSSSHFSWRMLKMRKTKFVLVDNSVCRAPDLPFFSDESFSLK